MTTNSEILTEVLVTWAKPMVDKIIASRIETLDGVRAANEWVRKYFPVKSDYSIVNDLSFLAVPATEMVIEPFVRNGIGKMGLDDDLIPEYAAKLVQSMLDEAGKKGSISLFNSIEIEKDDLERLRYLLRKNLPVDECEKYKVIE